MEKVLKRKALNKWGLFWLVSIPMSIVMVMATLETDLSTGEGVSHMIGYSVRFAIPFIFMVVAASSLQILFPGPISKWWLRNRKYIGLCFAVAMAWQGAFIFIISTFLRDYYFTEIYLFRDELEGTIGYILLGSMVVTSFAFGRKHINPMQWKLIHKSGLYFLWAYPMSVYWWVLADAETAPDTHDYIFFWMGFSAFALRIAAWGKKRVQTTKKNGLENSTPMMFKALGSLLITIGLVASVTGFYWQKPVTAFFTSTAFTAELELWLPFWPFEPFLALFTIGMGTFLVTKVRP